MPSSPTPTPRRRHRPSPTFLPPSPLHPFHHSTTAIPLSPHPPHYPKPTRHIPNRKCLPPTATASKPPSLFDKVKHEIPLSRAFTDLLGPSALIRSGHADFKLCCPFHSDRSPSLHIYTNQNRFHCFGCGAGGSIIDFETLRTGDSSVSSALRSLAARYPEIARLVHMSPKSAPTKSPNEHVDQHVSVKKQWRVTVTRTAISREVQRVAAQMYFDNLWATEGEPARRYMIHVRGLSQETLRVFGCGYAPVRGDWMVRNLEEIGHPPEHAVIAGLARRGREKPEFVYDVFRDRVVTPIRNLKGETLAHAGRLLADKAKSDRVPKYVNGPETEIFKKRDVLFGIDIAKNAQSAKVKYEDEETGTGELGYVLMVEGYLDVMTIYEHTKGSVACVATMGTSVSTKQLEAAYDLLEDPVDGKIIINFDGDDAGIAAAERLCDSVIPDSTCAHVVHIAVLPPEVKDPDEFLRTCGSGDDYTAYLLEVALPWYDWRGRRLIIEEQLMSDKTTVQEDDVLAPAEGEELSGNQQERQEREMINLDSRDQSFDIQLGEYMKQQGDEMLVAFGAPPELIKRSSDRPKSGLSVSKDIIEALAKVLESAQRSIPGLNSGAVVHAWADSLSRSDAMAITPLYKEIIKRAEELSTSWLEISPGAQIKWMSPPPWIVEDLPGRKQRSIRRASGLTIAGHDMDLEAFMSDRKLVDKTLKRLKAQEAEVIPHIQKNRSERLEMLKAAPRRAAEEMILRCLIFASEADRLDALDKLLGVMVWCQERDLPFWTSNGRESLFEYLADAEGPIASEEMAAYLEEADWWNTEAEQLFVPVEDEIDDHWKTLRAIEIANPVAVVESTARCVAEMAGKVASRLALMETGDLTEKMLEKSKKNEFDEFDTLLARQISLRRAVNKTKYLNPEEEEMARKEEEKRIKELEQERLRQTILKQLETGSVPYPGDLQAEVDSPPAAG